MGKFFKEDHSTIVHKKSLHPFNCIGEVITKCQIKVNGHMQTITIQGMGVILSKRIVLTAAQLFNFKMVNKIVDDAIFCPVYQGQIPQNQLKGIKVMKIHIHPKYFQSQKNQSDKYDMAILLLEDNDIISPNQYINIKWDYNFQDLKYSPVMITGYRNKFVQNKMGQNKAMKSLYQEKRQISAQKDSFLLYRHTTQAGYAGTPLLVKQKNERYSLIGINKGMKYNYNFGISLSKSKQIFDQIVVSNNLQYYMGSYHSQDSEILVQKFKVLQKEFKQKNQQIKQQKSQIQCLQFQKKQTNNSINQNNKNQILFDDYYKETQKQSQKVFRNQPQFNIKIKVTNDKIQRKVSLQYFLKKQQKSYFKNKSSFQQIEKYFSSVSSVWEQLDQISQNDKKGELTQMIYKEILNEIPTPQEIKQHELIYNKIELMAKNQQDSLFTVMLCLFKSLKALSNEITVTFSQKSNLKSKVSIKIISTGYSTFNYKYIQKIQDEQTDWTFEQLRQCPKKFQKFQVWYKHRLQKQFGIKDNNILITTVSKGCIEVEWQTTLSPSDIAGNPAAVKKFKVHPYFKHFNLCMQDFDPRGNIKFKNEKKDIQFRGNWPYYQPIKCKRYGIKVWDFYERGNNSWLTMNNSRGQWTVGYHALRGASYKCQNGKTVLNSIMEGRESGTMLIPGKNNAYKGKLIGTGIYFSPHLYESLRYCQNAVSVNEKSYHLAFQCRLNPKKIHITPRQEYWVLNKSQDIRPYGIILIQLKDFLSYPREEQQFKEKFQYRKYRSRIQNER